MEKILSTSKRLLDSSPNSWNALTRCVSDCGWVPAEIQKDSTEDIPTEPPTNVIEGGEAVVPIGNEASKKRTTAKKGGKPPVRPVQFSLSGDHYQEVFLAGSFTDWEGAKIPLKRSEEGIWSCQMKLTPGEYEYKFIVDGEWQNDPSAPIMENEFGFQNSLVRVE